MRLRRSIDPLRRIPGGIAARQVRVPLRDVPAPGGANDVADPRLGDAEPEAKVFLHTVHLAGKRERPQGVVATATVPEDADALCGDAESPLQVLASGEVVEGLRPAPIAGGEVLEGGAEVGA